MRPAAGWLFSPALLACANAVLTLVAFALPESSYVALLNEPKYVDVTVLSYVLLCIAAFCIGYLCTPKIIIGPKIDELAADRGTGTVFVRIITVFLVLISLLNIYSIINFLGTVGWNTYLEIFRNGGLVKEGVFDAYSDSVSGFSWLLLGALPILLVAFWLNWHFHKRIVASGLLYSAFLLSLARPALRGDRGVLLGFLASLLWLRLYFLFRNGRLSLRKVATSVTVLGVLGLVVFVTFQVSRFGTIDHIYEFGLNQLSGYYIGSYNRLGVQMSFGAPYPPASGYFTLSFLRTFPVLNKMLPLEEWIGRMTSFVPPVDTFGMWLPFGLDPHFNVVTAYGFAYIDFGWFAAILFLIYGIFSRVVVSSLSQGTIWGVMMYGPLIWTIFEWRGKLEVTYYNFTTQAVMASFVALLIAMIGGRRKVVWNK